MVYERYWRVGLATMPEESDPYYDDELSAIVRARQMHDAQGYNVPIAVFDERHDILHLFICGEHFKPA